MRPKTLKILMVISLFLLVGTSCTYQHFGVSYRAIIPPSEFDKTDAAIADAELYPGARYCPDKIAKAKELGRKAIETYLACRTGEALAMLAEARKLAKEAKECPPPPAPPRPPAPPAPTPPPPPAPTPAPAPAPPAPAPAPTPAPPAPPPPTPAPPPAPAPAPPPKPAPPPPPKPVTLPVFDTIYFDPNKTNISPTAAKALDRNGKLLKENPQIKLEIAGHTDPAGPEKVNQKISEKRAESAKKYLMDKFGIADIRLLTRGYGSTKPIADNKTEEGRAKNRRVEFRIFP